MRRLIATTLLGLAFGLAVPLSAIAATDGDPGPNCADITKGGGSYVSPATNGSVSGPTVIFGYKLAEPSCRNWIFKLFVTNSSSALVGPLLAQAASIGNGVTQTETFTIPITTSPPITNVCVYATVQSDDRKVFERAPGDGSACLVLTLDAGFASSIGFG